MLIKVVCVQGFMCSGGEEEQDEGSVLQRPMRFVHAAFFFRSGDTCGTTNLLLP